MFAYSIRPLCPNQPVTSQKEKSEQIGHALEENNLQSRVTVTGAISLWSYNIPPTKEALCTLLAPLNTEQWNLQVKQDEQRDFSIHLQDDTAVFATTKKINTFVLGSGIINMMARNIKG